MHKISTTELFRIFTTRFKSQTGCFLTRSIATSTVRFTKKSYKLVIVGGGSGGCAMAAKFATKLGVKKVAVIEPSDIHYYQPMWTLVGGGIKLLEQSGKPMETVIPPNTVWIHDKVVQFLPEKNRVLTSKGDEILYEILIVAMGLQLNFHLVKGLPDALYTPGVCSNYSSKTVERTYVGIRDFKNGNAIFTHPNPPIKCAGAPQKIMYLAEDYFRTHGKRDKANVIFNSAMEAIFSVEKYANRLMTIIKNRNISVNFKHNLIEVKPETKQAVFEIVGTNETATLDYELLHITPPMGAPDVLKNSSLADATGYLNVNKETLQHVLFPNIFGIGDCTNLPTSKTVAAVAASCGILRRNLTRFMEGKPFDAFYDGYTSCPLITSYGRCILAEFDYNLQPLETFPVDQGKERWTMYTLKKDMMPYIYWSQFVTGRWEGPQFLRRLMHLGLSK